MKKSYLFYLLFATCNFLFGQSGYYIPGPSQPFNYAKYREVLLNSAPLNDTLESGQKREVMRMDNMYGNSIISHGDMGAIYFSKNSVVNCGPNAVTDKTWSEIGPNLNNKNTLTNFENAMGIGPVSFITFDPDDGNIMFTGSWSSGLFYSTDKGQNWQNAGTDKFNNVSAAYCVANKKSTPSSPKVWFMATGHGHGHGGPSERISDGVFRSIDNGLNWELVGDYNDLQSQHWAPPSRPAWNFQVTKLTIDYNNENILFATTQSGIMKTTNALSANPTWTKVYPTSGIQSGHEYLCNDITYLPIANSPLNVNSNILFATVTDHWATTVGSTTTEHFNTKFIYSKDGGLNWNEVPGTSTILNPTVKINFEISVSNPNTIYIYELRSNQSSNLYKYTYSFDSNSNIISQSINYITQINTKYGWDFDFAIDNTDENHVLHGDIYRVKEMHLNLSSASSFLGSNVTHDDCQQLIFSPHDNGIWAGTHGGVYYYNQTTDLWETKNNGLGNAMCFKVDNNTNKTNSIAVALDHNGSHVSNTKPYTTEGWNATGYILIAETVLALLMTKTLILSMAPHKMDIWLGIMKILIVGFLIQQRINKLLGQPFWKLMMKTVLDIYTQTEIIMIVTYIDL